MQQISLRQVSAVTCHICGITTADYQFLRQASRIQLSHLLLVSRADRSPWGISVPWKNVSLTSKWKKCGKSPEPTCHIPPMKNWRLPTKWQKCAKPSEHNCHTCELSHQSQISMQHRSFEKKWKSSSKGPHLRLISPAAFIPRINVTDDFIVSRMPPVHLRHLSQYTFLRSGRWFL